LGQFDVQGTLEDPMMELYNGRGELLFVNDDWDPPNTTFEGSRIRRGVVDQYSEQAIFDTITRLGVPSMAPVEPALLVDLTPGSYTVIVRPFEHLPSGQPAVPGVGLVEVYEVPSP